MSALAGAVTTSAPSVAAAAATRHRLRVDPMSRTAADPRSGGWASQMHDRRRRKRSRTTFATPSWRGYALQLLTARGSLIAAAALVVSLVGAGNAAATVHEHGYLPARD